MVTSEFEKKFGTKESVMTDIRQLSYRDWCKRKEGALWMAKHLLNQNVKGIEEDGTISHCPYVKQSTIQDEIKALEDM